jgi:hypothetical protein
VAPPAQKVADGNERVYGRPAVRTTNQSDAGLAHDGTKKGRANMVAAGPDASASPCGVEQWKWPPTDVLLSRPA